jgi:hypothetical protein
LGNYRLENALKTADKLDYTIGVKLLTINAAESVVEADSRPLKNRICLHFTILWSKGLRCLLLYGIHQYLLFFNIQVLPDATLQFIFRI